MSKINSKQLIESGALLSLGLALSYASLDVIWAYGGSVTLASTLPIIFLAYKYGTVWGVGCGFIHGLLHFLLHNGLASLSYIKTPESYIAALLLDYFVAYAVIGCAGIFRKAIKYPAAAVAAGGVLGLSLRFLCHFLSGFIVWGEYAPEGMSVIPYSFIYNIGYMGPEIIITAITGFLLASVGVIKANLIKNN